jgi:hypothetical protein
MLKAKYLQEGDSEAILEMGRFYLRQGKLDKSDQYLRDAYLFQIKNSRMCLMFAGYLL